MATHPDDEANSSEHDDAATVRTSRTVPALEAIRKTTDRILALLCMVIFVALVVIVSWQVFSRQILQDSAPWTEEAARYTFVVLALLGAALVFSERGHIAVELLASRFPVAGQLIISVAVELIVIFFAVFVFVIGGYRVAANAWNQGLSTLPLSVGQVYMVLPLVGILITFYSIYHLITVLLNGERPTPSVDETAEVI
ncbi:TRAP transporter small permease [Cryobacterium sp. N22]|uniref:TRAP transporter small permease n=1 Tax=Cryobacterium sp. N22 TaxID=2048290 RepID=UPI000CE2F2B6|nr:TRAP transporter small permease [Cryobacterium sp. N22]